jgi:hypothetical protein
MTDTDRTCSFPGCDKPSKARSYCTGHYRQHWQGFALTPLRSRQRVLDGEKFCSMCEQTLPVEQFSVKGNYVQQWCKTCRNISERSRTYGISVDEVRALLARPCDVCGDEMASLKSHHIDHCHATGKVRGVLCNGCNTALGLAREDVNVLRALISYIERNT